MVTNEGDGGGGLLDMPIVQRDVWRMNETTEGGQGGRRVKFGRQRHNGIDDENGLDGG